MRVLYVGSRAAGWPPAKPLPPLRFGSYLLLLIGLLALSQALARVGAGPIPLQQNPPIAVWGEKPVLEYFILTPSLVEKLPVEADLSAGQMTIVEHIAEQEVKALRSLELESQPVVFAAQLTVEQKRARIAAMNYNRRIKEILRVSDQTLQSRLGSEAHKRLVNWVERQWVVEKELHGIQAAPTALRTYRVFATRYDSGGAYTVALPDQCLKFANAGNSLCAEDGYVTGADYTVFMSYEKSTAATVGEAGPWNIDDNFWATSGDPTPRRMFADLPLGMPEAQAAYFDGYNGGLDQFGRQVTAPFGIDLARQVSIDIGLEPGKNDWIDVSFMWTEGWDSGSAAQPGQPVPSQQPEATIIPVQTAAPKPDGSIVHTVQEGQSLWSIGDAYQVNLAQILTLNGLTEGALIFPGQELLVQSATTSLTPTGTGRGTGTPVDPTRTLAPSLSPTRRFVSETTALAQAGKPTAGPGQSTRSSPKPATAVAQAATGSPPAIDTSLVVILGIMLAGLGLLLAGMWLNREAKN